MFKFHHTSLICKQEVVETKPTTTQQTITPFILHLQLQNKITAFPQTTIKSTVKLSGIPKNSQMDYQTLKPVTTPGQTNKQKISNRNNFSNHNYNFLKNPRQQNPPT